jgi:hypothetical protein
MVAACSGTTLPEPLNDLSSQFFIDATSYGLHSASSIFNRTLTDPFAADMVNYIREKWEKYLSSGKPQMALWSGHDTTVAPFLTSLDMFDGFFPSYATLVTLEIYTMKEKNEQGNTVYTFRVTRNGDVVSGSKAFSISLVGSLIPLDLLWSRFPGFTDWNSFCRSESSRPSNQLPQKSIMLPVIKNLRGMVNIYFWLLLIILLVAWGFGVMLTVFCYEFGFCGTLRRVTLWEAPERQTLLSKLSFRQKYGLDI